MCGIIYEGYKSSKAARISADSSTYFQSDSLEINTEKRQGHYSFLVDQLRETIPSLKPAQKYSKQITEESVTDSDVV